MIKAAIIGLGTISVVHLDAIASNPEIKLSAVCDVDPALKSQAPEEVPFYTAWGLTSSARSRWL